MATPGKGSKKEKKKPIQVKTSLNNPYDLKWAPLEKGLRGFIIKTLNEEMDALGLRKTPIKVRVFRSKRKAKKQNSEPAAEAEKVSREPGWSNESLRKQLAIGINEVTKGLERDELSLVLVCGSAKPAHMTSHLIPLSKTRAVPACQVQDLSGDLSGVLGLTSVLALGFKRGGADFASTVGKIAAKLPALNVAWMPGETKPKSIEDTSQGGDLQSEPVQAKGKLGDSLSDPVKSEDQTGDSQKNTQRGQKRKCDFSPEPADELSLILQPLKVKKTIPNPSKIRKIKKKKAKQK